LMSMNSPLQFLELALCMQVHQQLRHHTSCMALCLCMRL
jgi:hypothetical protein